MSTIPEDFHDLLSAPNTAVFTTLQSDGSPNASPVWFLFTDDAIVISTRAELAKCRNARRDPRASLTVVDPARPMRYIEIRGTVTVEDDPSAGWRDRVVGKHGYDDGSAFDPPDAVRVSLHLRPTRVILRNR